MRRHADERQRAGLGGDDRQADDPPRRGAAADEVVGDRRVARAELRAEDRDAGQVGREDRVVQRRKSHRRSTYLNSSAIYSRLWSAHADDVDSRAARRRRSRAVAASARRPRRPDDAQGLQGPARVEQQPGPRVERRQLAAHRRRDGDARRSGGPRRGHPSLGDRRRQRVRLAAAAAAARLLRRQRDAERRLPARRFLRRRPGPRAAHRVADGARQLERPVAQQLLADAVRESASASR